MVTSDDVLTTRWSSHCWVKMLVFSPFLTIKVKACGWNGWECLFICYFTRQAQKKMHIYRGFNLILGKIQVVGQHEPLKTWKKQMRRETRAETTVTNAKHGLEFWLREKMRWEMLVNKGVKATNKRRLSIDSSNQLFLPWILKPCFNFVANRRKYRYMTWIIYPLCLLISLSAWMTLLHVIAVHSCKSLPGESKQTNHFLRMKPNVFFFSFFVVWAATSLGNSVSVSRSSGSLFACKQVLYSKPFRNSVAGQCTGN